MEYLQRAILGKEVAIAYIYNKVEFGVAVEVE